MPRHPLILAVAPRPIARDPHVSRGGAGRGHFLLRGRWRLHHHDGTATHGAGDGDGGGLWGRGGIHRGRRNGRNGRRRWRRRRGHDNRRGLRGTAGEQTERTADREERHGRGFKPIGASGNIRFHTPRQTPVAAVGSRLIRNWMGVEYPMSDQTGRRSGSLPVSLDKHIPVIAAFPPRLDPRGAAMGRSRPAAIDPHVLIILPRPVARLPHHIR